MFRRLMRGLGVALIAAAALILLPLAPALAQDSGGTADTKVLLSVAELILGALGTVALPTILAIWSLVKSHAAQTEAQWDDWMVARVEQVTRQVVRDAGAPSPAPAPLDARGKIGTGGAP